MREPGTQTGRRPGLWPNRKVVLRAERLPVLPLSLRPHLGRVECAQWKFHRAHNESLQLSDRHHGTGRAARQRGPAAAVRRQAPELEGAPLFRIRATNLAVLCS